MAEQQEQMNTRLVNLEQLVVSGGWGELEEALEERIACTREVILTGKLTQNGAFSTAYNRGYLDALEVFKRYPYNMIELLQEQIKGNQ